MEPKAVHRPGVVPVHWMDQVREDLERDIALGVLERVPQNTPIDGYWGFRFLLILVVSHNETYV